MAERLIVRLSTDYLVRWARLTASALDADIAAALAYATAYQVSTSHLGDGPAARRSPDPPAGAERRAVTVYAIASALGQSRETVRRKVKALAARGLLSETPAGVCILDTDLESESIRGSMREVVELTRGFQAAFAAAGLAADGGRAAPETTPRPDLIVRAANTFCLRMIEAMRPPGGDVVTVLLFCALSVANTRHLEIDPQARHSAFLPAMPDAARRPLTALALSAEMGLPRETTRRHLGKLVAAGGCKRVPGGFIAVEAVFETPEVQAMRRRIATDARRFMASLAGTGLIPAGRAGQG